MVNPLVSVIIPTKNSSKTLEACLESIRNQTYKNIEIIIVDQESIDTTIEIAKKFDAQITNIPKSKFYTPPTKSRNIGSKNSNGEILYHIDSDMELTSELILEIVNIFKEKKEIGALIIHEVDIVKGFWSKVKAFERKFYWNNDKIESARACRRSVFNKIGGYDENISSGEDFDIHKRYKEIAGIDFCKNTILHNVEYLNFFKLINKKYNYGKTGKLYFKKNNTSGFILLKEQFLSYLKNYKEFIRYPILGFSSIFLKILEFTAGFLGMIKNNKT